jgi:uncharacterized membrane protein affecting hemolysin expression
MKRYSSLRRKLTALIAGGGIVSALIAAAGFSYLDVNRFWQNTNAKVRAIGSIVADQVEPAISLGDRKSAAEVLNSLRADPTIRDAALYDPRGGCFARMNSPSAACPPLPSEGLHRLPDAVVLVRSIRADGERQGTLVLSASVPSMTEMVRQYLGGAALIIALSLVVAAVLAVVLQARVSAPILAIAKVAQRISQTHQFDDRVQMTSADELGCWRNHSTACWTKSRAAMPNWSRRLPSASGSTWSCAAPRSAPKKPPASRASSWPI